MTTPYMDAYHRIERQFTSGNNTPVERASVRREDWDTIVNELCHTPVPDDLKTGTSSFMNVMMSYHNTLCLYDGYELVRLIGFLETEEDYYFKVVVCQARNPEEVGKIQHLSCVGSLHPLIASLPKPVYERMESNLAMESERLGKNLGPVDEDFVNMFVGLEDVAGYRHA